MEGTKSSFFKLHHIQITPVPRKGQEAMCELKVWEKLLELIQNSRKTNLDQTTCHFQKDRQRCQEPGAHTLIRDEEYSLKALIERLQLSVTCFHDYPEREQRQALQLVQRLHTSKEQRSHAAMTRKIEEPGSPSGICLAVAGSKACPSRDGEAGQEG